MAVLDTLKNTGIQVRRIYMRRVIMKKSARLLALLAACAMLLGLAACQSDTSPNGNGSPDNSGQTGKSGGTLIVPISTDPPHFNGNAAQTAGGTPASNIFSRLFRRTVTGVMVNDLVDDYSISEDGLVYTFNLHSGVKWHDGTPFTSEDVKFTYETHIREKGQNVEYIEMIENIECPDENTVIFHLSRINAPLINVLTFAILPKHLYEGTDWLDNPANQHPIGTGPFKFVERNKGVSITVEANDEYFRGRPAIDKIVFTVIPDENTLVQSYLNNEIDVIDLSAAVSPAAMPTLENAPGTNIKTMISADRQYMITNLSKEPWSDVRVRRAVAMAVNREEMVDKAHKGYAVVAEGFYTPAVEWAHTDKYKLPAFDVEGAKALLDEAGLTPDANGVRIKDCEIVIFQFAVFSDMARIVQSSLKEIGIECTITTLEYAAWDERCANGDFDIAIIGGYHGPDPEVMRIRIGAGGVLNYMQYHSDEIEDLLLRGSSTSDIEERQKIYYEMQRVMSEDLPVIPLTEWCYIVITRDYVDKHYVYETDTAGSHEYRQVVLTNN